MFLNKKKDIDRTKLCSFPSSDLELTKWPWVKVMRHNHIISNLLCEVRISKLQISLHKKDLDWHDFRDWGSDRQMDKIIPVYTPPPKKTLIAWGRIKKIYIENFYFIRCVSHLYVDVYMYILRRKKTYFWIHNFFSFGKKKYHIQPIQFCNLVFYIT